MDNKIWYNIGDHVFSASPVPTKAEVALNTFLVILPNNERREVKAAYMEVDGSSLYFEDDNRETILAFAPGHWVWAERIEDNENH